MKKFSFIKEEWNKAMVQCFQMKGLRRIFDGSIETKHYKEILKQIYLHARENPQIQALATVHFRGSQRNLIKDFYRHALSEIGHDGLAMNDLMTLGEDIQQLPVMRPLPATAGLLSFAFRQIEYDNPISYLGYLFHLEFLPTQHGARFVQALERIGIPRSAMSFIFEHTTVDPIHNKYMEKYIEKLVLTEDDVESVVYAAKATAFLYCHMIEQAIEHADLPFRWGTTSRERSPVTETEKEDLQPAFFM